MNNIDQLMQSALVQHQQGNYVEAQNLYQQTLTLHPTHSDALHLLGVLHHQNSHYSSAEILLRKAVKLKPEESVYMTHLGNLLREIGQVEEAIKLFKKALRTQPNNPKTQLSLLVSLIASPDIDEKEFFRYFSHWAKTYNKISPLQHPFKQPEKKINIGYVSPDFRHNSAAWLYRLVFEYHNRDMFKIFAYSEVEKVDNITNYFKQASDQWIDTTTLSDQQLIKRIQEDNIDILVDMAGHTANNRLSVFAHKPAPILVTGFAGFTTGMNVFDYRLTDQYVTPPNWSQINSEKLFYLPHHVMHWKPPANELQTTFSPWKKNEFITFGSGHQLFKLNKYVIKLWSQILLQVPHSKIHLKAKPLDDPQIRKTLTQSFQNHGIQPERLIFTGNTSHEEHLAFYQNVDLVLEAFPCSGGITTCEVLWSGVPYLTSLRGSRSRAGISILKAMKVPELISKDHQDFVKKAIDFAKNPEQLDALRQQLREKFLNSPIADGKCYIRDIEAAYHFMWLQRMNKRESPNLR